jgi:hypothetical protein
MFADVLNDGLADDTAQALRERVVREIPAHLASNGQRLSIHHHLESDASGIGFATAIEMTAELAEGARRLFEAGLWYPGAALVRQLIECGCLLALMAEDRNEAASWMSSTQKQIAKRFKPGQMRERAARNFRLSEYRTHCEHGGHPNPAGRSLLRRHDEWRVLSSRAHWLDLAQHLAEIWDSFLSALPLYDPRMRRGHVLHSPERSPDGGQTIAELLAEWQKVDPVAARGPVPDATDETARVVGSSSLSARHRVSSFRVEGWVGQFERLHRWHQRLQELQTQRSAELTTADLDLVFAFFQTAYHLRDWMFNGGRASKADLDDLMRTSLPLKICRDLCLGSKHLVIDRPSVDPNTSLVREYTPGPIGNPTVNGTRIVVIANGKHELWPLVDDCMDAWEQWAATKLKQWLAPSRLA